jgi:L-ribulose-5-phosphate 3-epimerase
MNRRDLFRSISLAPLAAMGGQAQTQQSPPFRISLAEWSLHKAIFSRLITNLEFPRIARHHFGIEGLEFVNALWEAPTAGYIRRLQKNMDDTGTKGVLIMCDDEGAMGHSVKAERMKAAANHFKWVDAAAELGCHSIRCNMHGDKEAKTPAEIATFLEYCAESFTHLCAYGKSHGLNIIIENHGGLSSEPDVLLRLIKTVNLPNFGVLPDFGNFYGKVDRYDAVARMMPYAKGVSFKCYDFGPDGKHTTYDMDRLMNTVAQAGYHNWVGIEYEGSKLTEFEGIQAAKRYLNNRLRA